MTIKSAKEISIVAYHITISFVYFIMYYFEDNNFFMTIIYIYESLNKFDLHFALI